MPKSVATYLTLATAMMLLGGSQAQATTLTRTMGLSAAIHKARVTQQVTCRRDSNGRLQCWESNRGSPYQAYGYTGNPHANRAYSHPRSNTEGWQYRYGMPWGGWDSGD